LKFWNLRRLCKHAYILSTTSNPLLTIQPSSIPLVARCEGVEIRVSIARKSYHNDNDLASSPFSQS
jgi:hypothetical protein